jgi:hypothetical protein
MLRPQLEVKLLIRPRPHPRRRPELIQFSRIPRLNLHRKLVQKVGSTSAVLRVDRSGVLVRQTARKSVALRALSVQIPRMIAGGSVVRDPEVSRLKLVWVSAGDARKAGVPFADHLVHCSLGGIESGLMLVPAMGAPLPHSLACVLLIVLILSRCAIVRWQ